MNEQINQPQSQVPQPQQANVPVPETAPAPEVKKKPVFESLKEKFASFKANKKLFIPTTVAFGILVLVIILGLIYSLITGSGKNGRQVIPTSTPTPSANIQKEPVLSENQEKLKTLKDQIINLDIEQKRLQPPTLNFKISF